MEYIIQENLFKEYHYEKLEESLERLGLKKTTVRVFPFVDKITDVSLIPETFDTVEDLPDFNPEDNSKVFMFGSTKMSRIARDRGWYVGSLLNDNHDFEVYSKYYKDNLLNYDSYITTILGDDIDWKADDEVKFIRPTQDTKAFTGAKFNKYDYKLMIDRYLHNHKSHLFNEDTKIQVSTVKEIYKEIRFFVVDSKIVTGSQYRLGGQLILDSMVEDEAIEFAQSMVDLYQLAEAFVIDVCLTPNGWKIVECGCINCAGFYHSDLNKLIIALEEKFS